MEPFPAKRAKGGESQSQEDLEAGLTKVEMRCQYKGDLLTLKFDAESEVRAVPIMARVPSAEDSRCSNASAPRRYRH